MSVSQMNAFTAPKSPRVTSIRQAMYKKSPVRSPLRDMIKKRCQNRMREDRDKMINGVRNLDMDDGRSVMERTIKMFVQDELSSLRGGRRRLGFGFSSDDIENAIKEVEDIEAELLEEMYGVDINYADNMLNLETQIVCPVCQVSRVEDSGPSLVKCKGKNCGLVLVIVGGLATLQKELEALIESHSKHCPEELQFGKGDQCLVAMCDTCDHCSYIGGF